jgi:predicted O-methyltransferase YrrM
MKINPKELFEKYKDEIQATDGLEIAAMWESQYDDYSAAVNYSVVRELKPKVIVEFGSRTGRCTYDIVQALEKNGGKYNFKSYEKDDGLREVAQSNLKRLLKDKAVILGGDILKAKDIPDNIEYLFVDNSHDGPTTEWLFDTLLKKCIPGAIVQIHDIPLIDGFNLKKDGVFDETNEIVRRHKNGTLPLKMLYCASQDTNWESSWWEYTP